MHMNIQVDVITQTIVLLLSSLSLLSSPPEASRCSIGGTLVSSGEGAFGNWNWRSKNLTFVVLMILRLGVSTQNQLSSLSCPSILQRCPLSPKPPRCRRAFGIVKHPMQPNGCRCLRLGFFFRSSSHGIFSMLEALTSRFRTHTAHRSAQCQKF